MESLLRQDYREWSLLVRDDGSTDATMALLENWRERLGGRIEVMADTVRGNLGVVGNFSRLLNRSTAHYIMFADQDDVWHSDKIRLSIDAMRRREELVGSGCPILVHTDLALVDEHERKFAASYWRYQGLVPERGHTLGHIIVENIAWACTCILNRPLAELVGSIPEGSRFHDWWIAMVAAAFGEIVSLPVQTIDWRRHGANDSEITTLSEGVARTLTGLPAMRRRLVRLFEESRPRVRLFLDRYRCRLSTDQIATIEVFLNLSQLGFLARRRAVLQNGLLFTSWSRTLGLLLLL